MKNRYIFSVAAVVALLLCGSSLEAIAMHDGDVGKDVYEGSCIACHGEDGEGTIPGLPDFTDSEGRLLKTDETLIENITEGFESPDSFMAMPPKGGDDELTDEEIVSVLHYIRRSFGSDLTSNPIEEIEEEH